MILNQYLINKLCLRLSLVLVRLCEWSREGASKKISESKVRTK